jgi:hypothetical protein
MFLLSYRTKAYPASGYFDSKLLVFDVVDEKHNHVILLKFAVTNVTSALVTMRKQYHSIPIRGYVYTA